MSLRILLKVSPRQFPSSAILLSISLDADWPSVEPDFFWLLTRPCGETEFPSFFTELKGHKQDAFACGIMLRVGRFGCHGLSPP
jgi:hypothetical protein